jgi:hypothetical protein
MSDSDLAKQPDLGELSDAEVNTELQRLFKSGKRNRYVRLIMAALGVIPWVGGVFSGSAAAWAEHDQGKANELYRLWLEEHETKTAQLGRALIDITARLNTLGEDVQKRVESDEYLGLIRKGFKIWDDADSDEKRRIIQNLLAHAGATHICSDDVIRLFIEWIDYYNEIHFKVIRVIFQNTSTGISRAAIWEKVYGDPAREDSAEADLFKLLIRDMTMGGIIRQPRETDRHGRFVKKSTAGRKKKAGSRTMKSAFDDETLYVLTELGKQFVHYTMNEVVPRLGH